jgi:hypothetical protein
MKLNASEIIRQVAVPSGLNYCGLIGLDIRKTARVTNHFAFPFKCLSQLEIHTTAGEERQTTSSPQKIIKVQRHK